MEDRFDIIQFLKGAVASGASDEHLKVGYSPFVRKNGFIKQTNLPKLTKEMLDNSILDIVPPLLRDEILNKLDLDFMYEITGVSRFRVNYNRQMGNPALVIRNVPYRIPDLKELELPDILHSIVEYQNGIVLVTGPTGSGKSTTLASLIDKINRTHSKHIITIEDPIEYVFNSKKSIVSQRQIGVDTASYADGIKYALRQDPDVIFIGEIRDKETMEAALKASETGHLVFSTLHTNDAVQTINRIVNMFEESNRAIVRKQLAETLRATIAQKLIYSKELDKRFPACEIMVVTPTIKDYINKDNNDEIYNLLRENNIDNMVSLNTSLALLTDKGFISEEEALEQSNDVSELEKVFRGVYLGTKALYE
ncbi:PilT/PilU family type 4a pilus ATPase [bacterium]|nr:PilT/PilU family type 4a pilus ATPase [bacterium]